jgi:hypothetical protein
MAMNEILKPLTEPVGKVNEALSKVPAAPVTNPTAGNALPTLNQAITPAAPKTKEERQTDYLNRNNPSYVPRAKGGCVKKGGEPINVDKPVTFESFKGKGKS